MVPAFPYRLSRIPRAIPAIAPITILVVTDAPSTVPHKSPATMPMGVLYVTVDLNMASVRVS